MAPSSPDDSIIKAYWQPGCTSCLRMKEFLTKHGVSFVSINVLEDQAAVAELATLGIRSVPIVRRGNDWANGQVLREVARVAGVAWGGAKVLPVPELAGRLAAIQAAAQRLFAQIPEEKIGRLLPHRPRSYAQLAYHIFNIADAFLEHEVQGLPLREGDYDRVPPPQMNTKAKLLAYGADVVGRFQAWSMVRSRMRTQLLLASTLVLFGGLVTASACGEGSGSSGNEGGAYQGPCSKYDGDAMRTPMTTSPLVPQSRPGGPPFQIAPAQAATKTHTAIHALGLERNLVSST